MSELHTNPTQLTGLLVFALAALACARAAARDRGAGPSPWRALALLHAAFWLEVLLSLRHRVHDAVDALLQARGWYGSRAPLQVGLIVAALLLAAVSVFVLRRWQRARPRALAAGVCSVLLLWSFVIEAISLHGVDALMYAPIGPVMRIGWWWAACAAVVALTALRAPPVSGESVAASRR